MTSTLLNLKKDLALILILVVVIGAIIGGLVYADMQSGVFAEWSSRFYSFIMRR